MTPLERQQIAQDHALTYPGAWHDHPWGETVAKVGKKVFAFLGHPESEPGISVKLPHSFLDVVERPYASPTGYGLGKAGWVSVGIGGPDGPTLEELAAWIDESYRAVAPKKLVKELDARR